MATRDFPLSSRSARGSSGCGGGSSTGKVNKRTDDRGIGTNSTASCDPVWLVGGLLSAPETLMIEHGRLVGWSDKDSRVQHYY